MKGLSRERKDKTTLNSIVMISAWGLIMVISSFIFMYAGRWIDVSFNTEPAFMIGMLFLGICLCIFRLYREGIEKTRRMYRLDRTAREY
ncbi:MAG TPA: AtpZ/AtpI family protein [Desulfomonilia bacterium]